MDTTTHIPATHLSPREKWALHAVTQRARTPAENLELLDFLNYPKTIPTAPYDALHAVVLRILQARNNGTHIT